MRILPVIREFTGTWTGGHAGERLMLSETRPGVVQVLWNYCTVRGQRLILTGELTVKAAIASGYVYPNDGATPKPSWWQKLLRITPKPKPWGVLTIHFINCTDLFVSSRAGSYILTEQVRAQVGEVA